MPTKTDNIGRTGSFKLRKISGLIYKGHGSTFFNLISEFDDIIWSETRMWGRLNEQRERFQTGLVGRNYNRQRQFVERLNGIATIRESDYGIIENGNIV